MILRRNWWVYGVMLAIWGVLLAWQAVEHTRVRKSARTELIKSAKDISNTLGLVMRSQRRFGGVVSKERMESTLKDLVKPGELNAIALLNAAGEVVASAGDPIDLQARGVVHSGEYWGEQAVTLMNLVDLGTNVTQDLQITNLTIVVPRHDLTNRPPPPPDFRTNAAAASETIDGTNAFASGRESPRGPARDGRPRFGRPPWMTDEQYKSLIAKQGVHSFVLVMSTLPLRITTHHDLWLRGIIGVLATVSVVGSGLAWRNLGKSSELQIRLVRASELNSHLKEMNLAAAGLAHETRNPLNLIRGLAQTISKQPEASPEIRTKLGEMIDETDRVTAQLNNFINYSRPREVRRSAVVLGSVISEVVRALSYDIDAKGILLQTSGDQITVEADEQLLRQLLFNLANNAIQAVDKKAEIQIIASKCDASEASLEVLDNGPGVLDHQRAEIFKPYFTTHQKGTGLGLAVVQQIVLAHGWEIECLPNIPKGAIFLITHLKLVSKGRENGS